MFCLVRDSDWAEIKEDETGEQKEQLVSTLAAIHDKKKIIGKRLEQVAYKR